MINFSLNEVIELAVQIEKSGYQFYDAILKRKDLNSKIRELIECLRDEELTHEATFKNLRSSEDYEKMGDPVNWPEAASYLKAISDSHIFHKPGAAIKLATETINEKEILENAIQFEKDTLLFFHSIYDKTENERSKKIIKAIIDEEIVHVTKLKNLLNNE